MLAELAVSLVMVLTVLLGVMEMGEALYTYHFLADAAQMASRYAMVRGATCTGWDSACPAAASDVQSYVQSLAPTGINANALTVTTTWSPNNSPGSDVTVKVQYSFSFNVPLLPTTALAMTSQSEMVITQ